MVHVYMYMTNDPCTCNPYSMHSVYVFLSLFYYTRSMLSAAKTYIASHAKPIVMLLLSLIDNSVRLPVVAVVTYVLFTHTTLLVF